MRSALVTACMLLVGTCTPGSGVRQQFQHAPAQAQAALPQRAAHTERHRQGAPRPDIRRGNAAVAGESAVARRRAELHLPSVGRATDGQPPQPGRPHLPDAVGLLLSLALLSGAGAAPPPAIPQKEID
jgi:hypothetical protein